MTDPKKIKSSYFVILIFAQPILAAMPAEKKPFLEKEEMTRVMADALSEITQEIDKDYCYEAAQYVYHAIQKAAKANLEKLKQQKSKSGRSNWEKWNHARSLARQAKREVMPSAQKPQQGAVLKRCKGKKPAPKV